MKIKEYIKSLFAYTEKDLSYALLYKEELQKVEVKDIICEKGKEPIYNLVIRSFNDSTPYSGDHVEFTKSLYEEFIGDGVNAIRIKKADLYVRLFTKGSRPNLVVHVWRSRYPWDNQSIAFSKDDIISLGNSILENPNDYRFQNVRFQVDGGVTRDHYSPLRADHFHEFQYLAEDIVFLNRSNEGV